MGMCYRDTALSLLCKTAPVTTSSKSMLHNSPIIGKGHLQSAPSAAAIVAQRASDKGEASIRTQCPQGKGGG